VVTVSTSSGKGAKHLVGCRAWKLTFIRQSAANASQVCLRKEQAAVFGSQKRALRSAKCGTCQPVSAWKRYWANTGAQRLQQDGGQLFVFAETSYTENTVGTVLRSYTWTWVPIESAG